MFFQTFFQMMSPGVDYNLTLSRTEGKLTVLVMPKVGGLKDAAQHNLVPFTLTGAPDEIDCGFFPALQQPLPKAVALLTNMAEYEKQAEKAAASSKATKDEKSKADKEAKAKKDKYDVFMKKAEEMETAGNLDGALIQFQQARLHATDKAIKTVDEKIATLKAKMGQGSLFDIPAVVPATPQPAAVSAKPTQEQPQPAQAPMYPPMQGQPAQPPQPGYQPVPGHSAGQQPSSGWPVYQQMPQGGQPGYGPGMFGMAPGYGQGYPQQPYPQGGGVYQPEPAEFPHDPKDYEGIPDVHLTHVGQVMNQPHQAL